LTNYTYKNDETKQRAQRNLRHQFELDRQEKLKLLNDLLCSMDSGDGVLISELDNAMLRSQWGNNTRQKRAEHREAAGGVYGWTQKLGKYYKSNGGHID